MMDDLIGSACIRNEFGPENHSEAGFEGLFCDEVNW
jgi:hypothetical protein